MHRPCDAGRGGTAITRTFANALDRPIFVVGHPRSGTTLLASMLGRHPEVASTPESLYLFMARYRVEPVLGTDAETIVARLLETPTGHLVLDRQALVKRLRAAGRVDARRLFEIVLDEFRRHEGRARVLEKSPWHLRHIDELAAWFPDAKFVWIVRDGRAAVASLAKVPWASDDPVVLARQWVRNVSFGLASVARLPGRVHRVRFEELVADAPAAMAPLLDFLELPASAAIHDHARAVRTIKPSETAWKENVNRPLIASRADAWRTEFDAATARRLDLVMGPALARLGYQVAPARGTMGARLVERLHAALLYNPLSLSGMRAAYPQVMRLRERRSA